jgi:ribosomal-protein-alanine N-acetyltransferase
MSDHMNHNTNRQDCVYTRWIIRRDFAEVITAERLANPKPWTEDDFLNHLRKRTAVGLVAEFRERVIGHLMYNLHEDHLSVPRMAVHPAFRRYGIGGVLLKKLITKVEFSVESSKRKTIEITVPESCFGMHMLLKKNGFLAKNIVRGEDEDYYEFVYTVNKEKEVII